MTYELVVVGAGTAGLSAARTARRRGATVALVTDSAPGGDCTFVGCIPSKTLIEAAAQGADFSTATKRVHETVARLAAAESAEVLRGEGIDVLDGRARLEGPNRLAVAGRQVDYRRLVLATGAGPVIPPIPGLDDVAVLTNEDVFDLTSQPPSLLVVGGGPIGVELAQAFARLGTAVTIVEAARRLLPREEPEASDAVTAALAEDGVVAMTGRRVASAGVAPGGPDTGSAWVGLDDGTRVSATRVLVALGRRPDTSGLGLDDAHVAVDGHGSVVTDSHLRTTATGIFAAGDVTGRSPFTHSADEMGRVAAANALSRVPYRRFQEAAIPAVTFTDPEVARVGLTESDAAAAHPGARVAYLPLDELDRAVTAGRTNGYIKLIVAPRRATRDLAGGRLVGATFVAPRAGEMIALPALVMRTGMLPARLALTVQAYPTWTLGVRQAAAQLFMESGGRRARPAQG